MTVGMIRKFGFIFLIIAILAVIAACGRNDNTEMTTDAEVQGDEPRFTVINDPIEAIAEDVETEQYEDDYESEDVLEGYEEETYVTDEDIEDEDAYDISEPAAVAQSVPVTFSSITDPLEMYMYGLTFLTENIYAVDTALTLGIGMHLVGIPMLNVTFNGDIQLIEDGNETRVAMTIDINPLAEALEDAPFAEVGAIETYAVFQNGNIARGWARENGQLTSFSGAELAGIGGLGIPIDLRTLFFAPMLEEAIILDAGLPITRDTNDTYIEIIIDGDSLPGGVDVMLNDTILGMIPSDFLSESEVAGITTTIDDLSMMMGISPDGIPQSKLMRLRMTILVDGLPMGINLSVNYRINAFDNAVSITLPNELDS